MALSGPSTRTASSENKRSSCDSSKAKLPEKGTRKRPRPDKDKPLTRKVSHEVMCEDKLIKKEEENEGRGSPCRCVSEFDTASLSDGKPFSTTSSSPSASTSPFPNPLHKSKLLEQHRRALCLEFELYPMRLILSRLMSHPTHNRKGIFNTPVDPVAMGLPDYFQVVKSPMDLGTIKARLHAVAYKSRKDVAGDIRLVFQNAMLYNPPSNLVHVCARELLAFFEDHVEAFAPDLVLDPVISPDVPKAESVATSQAPAEQATDSVASKKPQTIRITCSGKNVTAQFSGPPTPPSPSATPAHGQATRTQYSMIESLSQVAATGNRKRKKRGSKVNLMHKCQSCEGRTCSICDQGCLQHEPTLLICNGAPCAGARIRKGALFFTSRDGVRQYCQRCYAGLPAVLPGPDDGCRYKRDLLKRKNDEEVAESWVRCTDCLLYFHRVCVMVDGPSGSNDSFSCPGCTVSKVSTAVDPSFTEDQDDRLYSFLTGEDVPVPLTTLTDTSSGPDRLTADSLPETAMSRFIQQKVQDRMKQDECPNAEKTVSIRVISDCSRFFEVPEVVRRHFKMQVDGYEGAPPTQVGYRSKAIALFQRIDGLDVCIFCMYVQEYDGNDIYADRDMPGSSTGSKRVYIAYLDSVEHFRPRSSRTEVYHEILVAYLASARERGYESAHIWACPPVRGNSFVFWNHPSSQRTPTRERLISWYHGAISRAISCGIVTDVKSLYESSFENSGTAGGGSTEHSVCPPLLDGDFWIEEATRLHGVAMSRIAKSKIAIEPGYSEYDELCPARQMSLLLRRVIENPISMAFRRPVNAAALNLKDYHKVIRKPMDLATIQSRCLLGEYRTLSELVDDFNLVVSNAKKYNPKGHFVHNKAGELASLFFNELNSLALSRWRARPEQSWEEFREYSLSLDHRLGSTPVGEGDLAQTVAGEPTATALTTALTDGPEAVEERMVGQDKWLIEKKGLLPAKPPQSLKRKKGPDDEPPAKRRRQTWLGDEVGEAVRKLRTSFFTCSLSSHESIDVYKKYTQCFEESELVDDVPVSSTIVDARHGFLEFSQFRNLEFDSLRHAKFSTSVLLYYLHNQNASGMVPVCSSCCQEIEDVRWHKMRKLVEIKPSLRCPPFSRKTSAAKYAVAEELCSSCHTKHEFPELFIPLQVTLSMDRTKN